MFSKYVIDNNDHFSFLRQLVADVPDLKECQVRKTLSNRNGDCDAHSCSSDNSVSSSDEKDLLPSFSGDFFDLRRKRKHVCCNQRVGKPNRKQSAFHGHNSQEDIQNDSSMSVKSSNRTKLVLN